MMLLPLYEARQLSPLLLGEQDGHGLWPEYTGSGIFPYDYNLSVTHFYRPEGKVRYQIPSDADH